MYTPNNWTEVGTSFFPLNGGNKKFILYKRDQNLLGSAATGIQISIFKKKKKKKN